MMKLTPTLRWIRTLSIFLIMILQAFCINIFFSTLMDLEELFEASTEVISLGLTMRCAGLCLGSLISAILFNRFDRMTTCIAFLMFEGTFIAVVTNVRSLHFFYISKLIIGFSYGVVESGIFPVVSDMWQESARPIILTIELIRMLANAAGPQLVSPFVSQMILSVQNSSESEPIIQILTSEDSSFENLTTIDDQLEEPTAKLNSTLWIPFAVVGILINVSAGLALCLQCYLSRRSDKMGQTEYPSTEGIMGVEKTDKEMIKEEEKKVDATINDNKVYVILTSITCCSLVLVQAMIYNLFFQFWTTFLTLSEVNISKDRGLFMLSFFSLFMALSIVITLILSKFIKPLLMLTILVICLLSGHLVLLFFSNHSELMLWLAELLLALGHGSYFSTVYIVLQERLRVTSIIASFYIFSTSIITALGVPVVVGKFIKQSPFTLTYVGFGAVTVMLLALGVLRYLDHWKASRMTKK